jgi:hypothetical protein
MNQWLLEKGIMRNDLNEIRPRENYLDKYSDVSLDYESRIIMNPIRHRYNSYA